MYGLAQAAYDKFYENMGLDRAAFIRLLVDKNIDAQTYQQLEPYLIAREHELPGFNKACSQLFNLLTKIEALDQFRACFELITSRGIKATAKMQNENNHQVQQKIAAHETNPGKLYSYHSGPHAAEMALDVTEELTEFFTENNLSESLKKFFIPIAAAAAGGHDRVQHLAPPENEKMSAKITADDAAKILIRLKKRLLAEHPHSPYTQAEIRKAFADFMLYLDYLFNQLIVAPTFLLWDKNAKPLLSFYYVCITVYEGLTQHTKKDKPAPVQFGSPYTFTDLLDAAGITISAFDTSRSISARKMHEKNLYKKFKTIDARYTSVIEAFFSECNIHEEHRKEGFLLRITQHLRMYPELFKDLGQIHKLENLVSLMHTMCEQEFHEVDEAHEDLFMKHLDHFIKDESLQGHKNFAHHLSEHDQKTLAAQRNLHGLLSDMDQKIWERHANNLIHFQQFYKNRIAEDKKKMARILLYLAAQQPGVDYVKQHKKTHHSAVAAKKRVIR